jgi:hypothetical protein
MPNNINRRFIENLSLISCVIMILPNRFAGNSFEILPAFVLFPPPHA